MPEPIPIKSILVPAVLVITIFVVVILFPSLGLVIGILSPVPLILIYLQKGKQVGFISIGVVAMVIFLVLGVRHVVFFVCEYAVMALIMAETIRMGFSFDRTVLFSGLGSAFMTGAILILAFTQENLTLNEFLEGQIESHLEQSMETFRAMEKDPEAIQTFEKTLNRLAQSFAISFPAFIFVGSLFGALINYGVVRFLYRRMYGESLFFQGRLSAWSLPEPFIWLLIVPAAVLWFSPPGGSYAVALNVFILAVIAYGLQGVAIGIHFLELKSVPVFLWFILLIFVLTQPLLIGILIGLGIFDLWVDFRKLSPPKPPPDDSGEDDF